MLIILILGFFVVGDNSRALHWILTFDVLICFCMCHFKWGLVGCLDMCMVHFVKGQGNWWPLYMM